MANSVTARFNDGCKVFVSMSDDTTVEKAVIIDAEGNETDIGGGGGSSDFSTAEVTIEGYLDGDIIYLAKAIDETEDDETFSWLDTLITSTGTINAVLYKGQAVGYAPTTQAGRVTVSGNVQYDSKAKSFFITGSGTITIAHNE